MKIPGALIGLPVALVLFPGCVSARYKMAKTNDPRPVVALNLTNATSRVESTRPPLEVTVHAVLVHQGPGSWKRAAYWDEYLVTLVNRDASPLTVESATLIDFQGQPASPGDNPWSLEKQSLSYEKRMASTVGDVLKVGGATVLSSATAGGVAVVGAMHVGSQLGAAMVVGGTVFFAAATVVVPVWSVVANVNSRHEIEAEYRRRRLTTPLFLVPGQIAQGSFFFRISPGPRQLLVHCRLGEERRDFAVDLAPLARLHLKP